jgi:hypothetical protein
LRQASLALFQFENNKQRFPGYLNRIGGQPASWVVPVVPYLERVDLLQAWEGRAQSGKPEPLAVTLNFLVCPADESNRASLTPLSYVANAGIPDLPRPDGGPADKLAHGVFHNRLDPQAAPAMTLKFLADHDGTACTLLLSENVQAGQWAGSGQYLTRPNGQPVVAPKGFFTPQQAERLTAIVWHAAQAKPATAVAERRINVGHDRGRDGLRASTEGAQAPSWPTAACDSFPTRSTTASTWP